MFRRFLRYYRPYMGLILIDLFCAAASTVCELAFPLIVRKITNTALSGTSAMLMSTVIRLSLMYLFTTHQTTIL